MLAQALLERGMLEGLITGLGTVVSRASFVVRDHPWLWIVAAVLMVLLLRGGRRGG